MCVCECVCVCVCECVSVTIRPVGSVWQWPLVFAVLRFSRREIGNGLSNSCHTILEEEREGGNIYINIYIYIPI